MLYLKTYLQKIKEHGNVKLAESISKTAEEVGETYLKNFSFTSHEVGLLFGNVQSGKTGQMFGIMCKATDLGFPVFLVLTTDNVVLQQQTLDRVKADLEGFCICGENDARIFTDNSLLLPTIVVLKKNARILKLWANIFNSTGFMKGNPLFIVDVRNFLLNRVPGVGLKRLQANADLFVFPIGLDYLGGDFFFPKEKPECIQFLEELENPTRSVVLRHIACSAQILASGGKVCNCLFHPSVRQAVHAKFEKEVKDNLIWCSDHLDDEFETSIRDEYERIHPQKSEIVSYEEIIERAKELVKSNAIKVIVMNGKNEVDSSEYEAGCNFVIGGNTLGRGVTFPCLQTIYYTRTSKNPQADTMWQHSRMFGYDRDPGAMKVFIDERLYKLFSDINATNNSIIAQVERGIESIKIYYPAGLNPTRKNVIDNDHVIMISGGTNYYPSYPDNNTIGELTELLKTFNNDEPYYQVSLRFIRELLKKIIPSDDFKLKAFISVIDSMLADVPTGQGILIVRRNRDVAQGTGALLSPNDWQLGAGFTSQVVLTMYQVTGRKGWGGKQLWVPNIKLPDGVIYYDISEE